MALVQKAFSDIITFSRSSNATRIGPTGLVEYAPHNLLTYSEQFDDASWNKSNVSVTANAIAAPDGTVTADTLTENTANQEHFTNQQTSKAAANISYTFSVYVKRGTSGTRNVVVAMTDGISGGYEAVFDPDDGAILIASRGIGVTTGWTAGAATATNAGNGWWRFTFSAVSNTSTRIDGVVYIADGTTKSYTGNGSSNLFLWGAQLAVGPYALDYTPTTSAAVYGPRFDFDPVTLAARGLLVEEQRVNVYTYSEQFDNVAWSKGGSSITANAGTAPDGTVTADKIVEDSGTTPHVAYQAPTVSAVAYTLSVFAKAAERTQVVLDFIGGSNNAVFNLSAGTVVSSTGSGLTAAIQDFGNGWYRCSITQTQSAGTIFPTIGPASGGNRTYTGNGTSGIFIWGAQLEAGSFATSYIPTIASTVTRSADVASVDTLSPWWNATESTIYSEFDTFSTNDAFPYSFGTKNNNEIGTYRIGSNGNVATLMFASTVLQNNSTIATGTALNATIKAAYAIKANDLAGSANGGAAVTDTTATLPSVSTLYLGSRDDGTGPLNGHLRRLAVYPRRLTNAELQALTA